MANLAIKGHATRGREVIELLEMLGGINHKKYSGDLYNEYYFINDNYVDWSQEKYLESDSICFTLEEFLEKYPYKVGDKVKVHDGNLKDFVEVEIISMRWFDNEVLYNAIPYHNLRVKYLQPYKKETMEETKEDLCVYDKLDFEQEPCADKIELVLGDNFEIKVEDGKTYAVRKKAKYPKTYEECCELLFPNSIALGKVLTSGYNCELLKKFGELLICRDAYWKIAGEQMGLGKPWEPDWTSSDLKYVIKTMGNAICNATECSINCILAFPTEEMRDAFYENFKESIEKCKELL